MIELTKVRNIKEFSKKYAIPYQLLIDWKIEAKKDGTYRSKFKEWAKNLTPNVVGRLYQKIMEEGDAARIKLWKEFIEEEGDKLSIDASLAKIIKNMEEDGEEI